MDLVKPVWEQFDCYSFQRQPAIEETALKLLQRDPVAAAEFLTTYSNSVAQEALTVVQDMFVKLFTRIAVNNHKRAGATKTSVTGSHPRRSINRAGQLKGHFAQETESGDNLNPIRWLKTMLVPNGIISGDGHAVPPDVGTDD